MDNIINSLQNLVVQQGDVFITTSQRVAEVFGKNPRDILRIIRAKAKSLKASGTNASGRLRNLAQSSEVGASKIAGTSEFADANFQETTYINEQGKAQPSFNLTKDGFMFLVMGFTGELADQCKVAFINEFNRMEHAYKQHLLSDVDRSAQGALLTYLDNVRLTNELEAKPKTREEALAEQVNRDLKRENDSLRLRLQNSEESYQTLYETYEGDMKRKRK